MNDRPTNTALEARLRTALSEMIPKLTDATDALVGERAVTTSVPASLPDSQRRPQRGPGRVLVAMAMAAAVVLTIVGLVAVASRNDDSAPADEPAPAPPLSRHSVATDLPGGWVVKGAVESAGMPEMGPPGLDVYATTRAPDGPIVAIARGGSLANDAPPTRIELADGRRATIGHTYFGARWLDVEVEPNRWIGVAARTVDDDTLRALALQLAFDADDVPTLQGPLPLELTAVGASSVFTAVPFSAPLEALASWPVPMSSTGYGPPDGPATVFVSILDRVPSARAAVGLLGTPTPVASTTATAYEVSFAGGGEQAVSVYAERDDAAIWATSATQTMAPEQLVTLVDSLEPVAPDVWAELTAREGFGSLGDDGSPEGDVPLPTETDMPVFGDVDVSSVVEIVYDVTQSDLAASASATLPSDRPSGGTVGFELAYAGRRLSASALVDGRDEGRAAIDVDVHNGASMSYAPLDSGGLFYTFLTDDERASELRLAYGGVEYRTQLLTLDAYPGVKLAIVVVPGAEPAFDSDGRALDAPVVGAVYSATGEQIMSL